MAQFTTPTTYEVAAIGGGFLYTVLTSTLCCTQPAQYCPTCPGHDSRQRDHFGLRQVIHRCVRRCNLRWLIMKSFGVLEACHQIPADPLHLINLMLAKNQYGASCVRALSTSAARSSVETLYKLLKRDYYASCGNAQPTKQRLTRHS